MWFNFWHNGYTTDMCAYKHAQWHNGYARYLKTKIDNLIRLGQYLVMLKNCRKDLKNRVRVCCLTPTQFFSYIMARTSFFSKPKNRTLSPKITENTNGWLTEVLWNTRQIWIKTKSDSKYRLKILKIKQIENMVIH